VPAWRALAEQARLSDLLRYQGCLYFYRGKMPQKDSEGGARLRNELGVRQEWLTSAEVAKLEPALPRVAGGLFFPDAAHTVDPAVMTGRLAAAAEGGGGSFERARGHRRGAA